MTMKVPIKTTVDHGTFVDEHDNPTDINFGCRSELVHRGFDGTKIPDYLDPAVDGVLTEKSQTTKGMGVYPNSDGHEVHRRRDLGGRHDRPRHDAVEVEARLRRSVELGHLPVMTARQGGRKAMKRTLAVVTGLLAAVLIAAPVSAGPPSGTTTLLGAPQAGTRRRRPGDDPHDGARRRPTNTRSRTNARIRRRPSTFQHDDIVNWTFVVGGDPAATMPIDLGSTPGRLQVQGLRDARQRRDQGIDELVRRPVTLAVVGRRGPCDATRGTLSVVPRLGPSPQCRRRSPCRCRVERLRHPRRVDRHDLGRARRPRP